MWPKKKGEVGRAGGGGLRGGGRGGGVGGEGGVWGQGGVGVGGRNQSSKQCGYDI